MDTLQTIKDILQEKEGIDPATVTEDSTFATLGIDSLSVVEMVYELEERLNIDCD